MSADLDVHHEGREGEAASRCNASWEHYFFNQNVRPLETSIKAFDKSIPSSVLPLNHERIQYNYEDILTVILDGY